MEPAATYKLAFIGEPGAGKTTCIAAVSDIVPVSTDVGTTDELSAVKETTTVALDYGEMNLGDQGRLLLYGLPGQARFQFMFEVVRENLLGVVLLVDALSADPMRGLRETLDTYAEVLRDVPFLVAINKSTTRQHPLRKDVLQAIRGHNLVAPIIAVDARRHEDVALIFDLIFLCGEYGPQ